MPIQVIDAGKRRLIAHAICESMVCRHPFGVASPGGERELWMRTAQRCRPGAEDLDDAAHLPGWRRLRLEGGHCLANGLPPRFRHRRMLPVGGFTVVRRMCWHYQRALQDRKSVV